MSKNLKIVIAIVVILIIILGVIYSIVSKDPNKITEKEFYKLTEYVADDEGRIQIIEHPDMNMADASFLTYYNIDLNNKIIIQLSRNSYYGMNPKTYYAKYEYDIKDEDVEYIKEQMDLLEKLNIVDDEKTDFQAKGYTVITSKGRKEFKGNDKANQIIENITEITLRYMIK